MTHERKVQLAWAALAAVLFVGAGLVADTRQTKGDMWEILPGRAFYVNYLWIRADKLKEEGKFYDAYQQAELICKLQRHFPGVWSFMSWNMAWNISVETHTPQERWRWVYNGVRLLRDQGIVYNPNSIQLYKDLGWIFLSKISGYLDDAHWVYKRQWALRMQDLLGAAPGNHAGSHRRVRARRRREPAGQEPPAAGRVGHPGRQARPDSRRAGRQGIRGRAR